MSVAIVDRVKRAHPLTPAHRMVLLAIAWQVPDGATEAIVNRTVLARDLDTNPGLVRTALVAGETLNLCRVLGNGHIAFSGYDGLMGVETTPIASTVAVLAVPPSAPETPLRPLPQAVLSTFSNAWRSRYGRSYPFTAGRDHKMAKQLGETATIEEIEMAAAAYIANEDPFYRECAHAFSVFHKQFYKFIVTGPRREAEDSVEKTKRYLASLRSGRGETSQAG